MNVRAISLRSILFAFLAITICGMPASFAAAAAPSASPPVADAFGELAAVQIDSGRGIDVTVNLLGPDAREQLVVTGSNASGQLRDLTGGVTYVASPPRHRGDRFVGIGNATV